MIMQITNPYKCQTIKSNVNESKTKQTNKIKTYKEKTKIIRNRPENNYIIILSIKGERTIAKRKRKYASI